MTTVFNRTGMRQIIELLKKLRSPNHANGSRSFRTYRNAETLSTLENTNDAEYCDASFFIVSYVAFGEVGSLSHAMPPARGIADNKYMYALYGGRFWTENYFDLVTPSLHIQKNSENNTEKKYSSIPVSHLTFTKNSYRDHHQNICSK